MATALPYFLIQQNILCFLISFSSFDCICIYFTIMVQFHCKIPCKWPNQKKYKKKISKYTQIFWYFNIFHIFMNTQCIIYLIFLISKILVQIYFFDNLWEIRSYAHFNSFIWILKPRVYWRSSMGLPLVAHSQSTILQCSINVQFQQFAACHRMLPALWRSSGETKKAQIMKIQWKRVSNKLMCFGQRPKSLNHSINWELKCGLRIWADLMSGLLLASLANVWIDVR